MNKTVDTAAPIGAAAPSDLARHAGPFSLWAMAVSAVIVGEFSGWNQGLVQGGFGGMLVATLLITVMYACLCCSIAEMGAAMPFAGGSYAYARTALGPWGGLLAGLSQMIAYVLSIASVVVTIGIQLNLAITTAGGLTVPEPVYWLVASAVFVFLNAYDTKLFFRSAMVLALGALAVLAAFWVAALPHFQLDHLLAIAAAPHGTAWLPNGLLGVAWAAPFAIWFYLAVEQVSLAAEESRRPERDMRVGLYWGLATLALAAVLTLLLNTGIPPGAELIGGSDDPLFLGLRTVFGSVRPPELLMVLALVGSLSSFHSIMYAAGRSIFGLSRAGYLPTALSATGRGRRTPIPAIATAAAASFGLALAVKYAPRDVPIAAILLSMSVFGAVISYIFQFVSFLILRARHADMARPYRSPLGPTGAMTGLMIAVATALLMYSNTEYRPGLAGCLLIYLIGTASFALFGRQRLTANAPEEAFAAARAAEAYFVAARARAEAAAKAAEKRRP